MVNRTLAAPFAVALLLSTTMAARAEALAILAPFVTVNVGDTFIVPISIADAAPLTSWQFDLTFDPAVVRVDAMTEGPFMSAFGATLFIPPLIVDNALGLISGPADFYIDVSPEPSGTGVLANIQFTALAVGVSPLTFSNVFLNVFDTGFDATNGQITVRSASPPPPPVPEPATFALIVTGAALFSRERYYRRRMQ